MSRPRPRPSASRLAASGLILLLLAPRAAQAAEPQPAPPYPTPPPRVYRAPPGRPYYPPPPVIGPPPPLSPLVRVIYAPFYAAGLVLRYGLYYGIVAPLEVFSRTLTYAVSGGVGEPPPPARPEHGT